MLRIQCPWCGLRDHEEFGYFGDASKTYPPLGAEHRDAWFEAVFMRDNPRGLHREFWQHVSGCRRWLVVERDTLTHDIHAVMAAREREVALSAAGPPQGANAPLGGSEDTQVPSVGAP